MEPIYVTKTFMPPIEEFTELLEKIWETHLVTNDGPFYQKFEQKLRDYTNVQNLACVGNGTLALQIGIKALGLKEEIITSPFTHIAGSDCMIWEQCKPVYADIDPETLNIDPKKIEDKITDKTTAIMPVHVYSNPCYIDEIEKIAKRHKLKTFYDAAHAFGTKYKGKSAFAYGDMSMTSFNATKAFHTMEGSALFAKNETLIEKIRKLAYFGMDKNKEITQKDGTNAKLIEVCAIMGIINLRYFDVAIKRRKECYELYVSTLGNNSKIRFQKIIDEINYSYMPIILETEELKNKIIKALNDNKIYPREYFYPSLETIFCKKIECKIAYDISHRIICLPMSDYLIPEQIKRICGIINSI